MSLINDALKRAQQAPKPPPSGTLAPPVIPGRALAVNPLPPAKNEDDPPNVWLVLGGLVGIIFIITLLITWLVARHEGRVIANTNTGPIEEVVPIQTITRQNITMPASTETPASGDDQPKLQGIFYSPTASSAIIDGKTVRVGDRVGQFRVQEIARTTATLVGSDGKSLKLTMSN
jgi:hypothetical protein